MQSDTSKIHSQYTFLADYYDEVMKDVDYPAWAEYIDDLIQNHHPNAETIHELSCGTGSILIELDQFGVYQLSGSDKSASMVEKASTKTDQFLSDLHFFTDDYLEIRNNSKYDIVLSVFDSLNYILDIQDFRNLFRSVEQIIAPNGYFIFDFTTPEHSLASIEWLDNEKIYSESGVRIIRRSSYDIKSCLHKNHISVFSLENEAEVPIGEEIHIQRAYTLDQIREVIHDHNWKIEAAYGDFELSEATSSSHRICMVCKPNS